MPRATRGRVSTYELEQYYYDIPKIDVLCSPSLMFGMSMLTAIDMDYEASDHWYRELRNYAAGLDKNDSEYYEISGKLLYLDIALPHRSADIIAENVAGLYELVRDKRVKIPRFSVTSMMPSVVNGGQDLSEWTVENDIIEKILGGDLERILGRDGVGLAECAACEISFERDEEVLQGMMRLAAGMSEIHRRGTPDTEFAATAVMARMHMRQGNAENALEMLEKLGCEFEERGEERLIPEYKRNEMPYVAAPGNAGKCGKMVQGRSALCSRPAAENDVEVQVRYARHGGDSARRTGAGARDSVSAHAVLQAVQAVYRSDKRKRSYGHSVFPSRKRRVEEQDP